MDRGSWTDLYGTALWAAMKNTDKSMVSRTAIFKSDSVVFIFLFSWSGLFCCVFVPGALALHLLYLDSL